MLDLEKVWYCEPTAAVAKKEGGKEGRMEEKDKNCNGNKEWIQKEAGKKRNS